MIRQIERLRSLELEISSQNLWISETRSTFAFPLFGCKISRV
jgi:hypothetical protein